MIIIWKNRGILVILYFIVTFLVCALALNQVLNFKVILGIAFLITGAWTYLTRDDYYKDKEGTRKKMDTPNELFFISMQIWAYIFFILSAISFIASIIS